MISVGDRVKVVWNHVDSEKLSVEGRAHGDDMKSPDAHTFSGAVIHINTPSSNISSPDGTTYDILYEELVDGSIALSTLSISL